MNEFFDGDAVFAENGRDLGEHARLVVDGETQIEGALEIVGKALFFGVRAAL